jgi:hypothetical protein
MVTETLTTADGRREARQQVHDTIAEFLQA